MPGRLAIRIPAHRWVPVCGVMALAAASAGAQTRSDPPATPARSIAIEPSVSVTETLTSNAGLSSTDKRGDLISSVAPRIRVDANSARVKGYLDYALSGVVYARDGHRNELEHALSASAQIEALEGRGFVDASASVSRQAISAFGTQSADPSRDTGNQGQVATWNVSPYLSGRLAGVADYQLRADYSAVRTDSGSTFDNSTKRVSATLAGATGFSPLGWSALASHTITSYRGRGSGDTDRGRLGLDYAITPELHVSANGGRERNELLPADQEKATTYGASASWRPSARTRVDGEIEKRAFGNYHNLQVEYRTPRTVWKASDVRDVSNGTEPPRLGSLGTIYDLLFSQYTAQYPDPILRARAVNDFLQKRGLPPDALVIGRILSSVVTLQRSQNVSFALLGLRDTITFSASRTDTRPLDPATTAGIPGNENFGTTTRIKQTGFGVDYSHRLTPQSSLNAAVSYLKTAGTEGEEGTHLRSVSVGWTGQVGLRTSVSMGARRSLFDGADAYNESAVFGTVRLEF